MKNAKRTILTAAALLSLCVISYLIWRYMGRYCSGLKAANLLRDIRDRVPVDCGEFWLNRYQGLIGNVLTAAIAGATLLWAARGFRVSNTQAAMASVQALRSRIAEEDREIEFLLESEEKFRAINTMIDKNIDFLMKGSPVVGHKLTKELDQYENTIRPFWMRIEDYISGNFDKKSRNPYVEIFLKTDECLNVIKARTQVTNERDTKIDVGLAMEEMYRISTAFFELVRAIGSAIEVIRAQRAATWRRVRELEAEVILT